MTEEKKPDADRDPWFGKLPELFEQWARDLRVELKALKFVNSEGKKKRTPNMANRMNRKRMREGQAPEIGRDLYGALERLEDPDQPTSTGRLMMGVEEWARIGQLLAAISPDAFEKALSGARDHLHRVGAAVANPPDFGDSKQKEPSAGAVQRAIEKITKRKRP